MNSKLRKYVVLDKFINLLAEEETEAVVYELKHEPASGYTTYFHILRRGPNPYPALSIGKYTVLLINKNYMINGGSYNQNLYCWMDYFATSNNELYGKMAFSDDKRHDILQRVLNAKPELVLELI